MSLNFGHINDQTLFISLYCGLSVEGLIYICEGLMHVMTFLILSCLAYFTNYPSSLNSTYLTTCHGLSFPGLIYLIGGISEIGVELSAVDCYNPITSEWTRLSPLLSKRAYVGVACLDGCIYAVGGLNDAKEALATAEKYSVEEVRLSICLLVFYYYICIYIAPLSMTKYRSKMLSYC